MSEEFNATKPIYLQIADRIYHQIIRNELGAGEKLPSVREMAVQSGVNPNTIGRTYNEMERLGIVETRRGQGTFVTENKEVIHDLKIKVQSAIMESFVQNMLELGFTKEDIVHDLQDYLKGGVR